MERYVCIHAHFYQPPRENPWLEDVEVQDSARPYHDWNERITAECYGPNAASRILGPNHRIIDIVNNYSKISFNFGPTLLSWLERRASDTYASILEADRLSRERFSGHGSALAQVYSHAILPLANARDQETQVLWGLADFVHRFGRRPEGMWLAETAADTATLEVLAAHGIRFTILAPWQARRVRPLRGGPWKDVAGARIDPKRPYLCRLPSGRSLCLFFYDGPISGELAFGSLLRDGKAFAERLGEAFSPAPERDELVHVATDGETYGHHHGHGDMALAYCLHHVEAAGLGRLTIYGEFLDRVRPAAAVEIFEGSSWSCVHGVERWRANCGCCSGGRPEWNQEWRPALREAMDWLRDELAPVYERELSGLLRDPWGARNAYVDVLLDRTPERIEAFLAAHAARPLERRDQVKVLKLLEMQRHALLMYTSCGWFFDEVSGIETVQVIQYAARALQVARETTGIDLEPEYVRRLEAARSNLPELEHGGRVYERFVKPAALDLIRVAAHHAVSSVFEEQAETVPIFAYTAESRAHERDTAGWRTLVLGRTSIRSDVTWEEEEIAYAVFHLGDHNVAAGVRPFGGEEPFQEMRRELREAFGRSDVAQVIRLIDRHFGPNSYSLWHLFRDAQRVVLEKLRYWSLDEAESAFRTVYENNYSLMAYLRELGTPLPKAFRLAAEYTIGRQLEALFAGGELDPARLEALLQQAQEWSLAIDVPVIAFTAGAWANGEMAELSTAPEDAARMDRISTVLALLGRAGIQPDLWKAQNAYFALGKRLEAGNGEPPCRIEPPDAWHEAYCRLGDRLNVSLG